MVSDKFSYNKFSYNIRVKARGCYFFGRDVKGTSSVGHLKSTLSRIISTSRIDGSRDSMRP